MRNTKVRDIYYYIADLGISVEVFDPFINIPEYSHMNVIDIDQLNANTNFYDSIIYAVSHDQFLDTSFCNWRKTLKPDGFIYDIKNVCNGTNVVKP